MEEYNEGYTQDLRSCTDNKMDHNNTKGQIKIIMKIILTLISIISLTGCAMNSAKPIVKYEPLNENGQLIPVAVQERPIHIVYLSNSVNSAGGVKTLIKHMNRTGRTLKYIRFRMDFYNRVGDRVFSEFGRSRTILKDTGPFESNTGYYSGGWRTIYNSTTYCSKFTNIDLDFMDGTKYTLNKDQLDAALKVEYCTF